MKQYFAVVLALTAGILMAYFILGAFIKRFFKGNIIDIIIVLVLVALIIAVVGIGLNIADHYFDIFPK